MADEHNAVDENEIPEELFYQCVDRLAIIPVRWISNHKAASVNPEIIEDEKFIEFQDTDIARLMDAIAIVRKAIPEGCSQLAWILNTTLAATVGSLMQNDSGDTDIHDKEFNYILSQLPIQLIYEGLINLERSELDEHQFETFTEDIKEFIFKIATVWRSYYADALQNKSYTISEAYCDDFIKVQVFFELMAKGSRYDVTSGLQSLMSAIAYYVVADRRVVEGKACDNLAQSFFNKILPDEA